MTLPILCAAAGAAWEARLIAELANPAAPLTITRRCVDVIELVAVAAVGHSVGVLIDPRLRQLDPDVVERLHASGVATVGVLGSDPDADIELLRSAGIDHVVPADAPAAVIAEVFRTALADRRDSSDLQQTFSDPVHASGRLAVPPPLEEPRDDDEAGLADRGLRRRPGRVIAVWGPTGAPGRTTVALNLADAFGRRDNSTILVDADVYGGVVASLLGLLDESPGLAAACRQAQSRRLDVAGLASLAWQVAPSLRVLTGLSRADRWPELRGGALDEVLGTCRRLAETTVVDLGFCLESDEELSFDSAAPRRNGATLAVLAAADLVLAVGSADPVGLQRLARGIAELRGLELPGELKVVLNRVRGSAGGRGSAAELGAALERFVGYPAAAMLPLDLAAVDLSVAAGRTLAEACPSSPLTRAVGELAELLEERVPTRRMRPERRSQRHRSAGRRRSRRAEPGGYVAGSDDA